MRLVDDVDPQERLGYSAFGCRGQLREGSGRGRRSPRKHGRDDHAVRGDGEQGDGADQLANIGDCASGFRLSGIRARRSSVRTISPDVPLARSRLVTYTGTSVVADVTEVEVEAGRVSAEPWEQPASTRTRSNARTTPQVLRFSTARTLARLAQRLAYGARITAHRSVGASVTRVPMEALGGPAEKVAARGRSANEIPADGSEQCAA